MKNLSLKNSVKVVGYFAFTGQEIDIDTGLYYYGARYYNPHSGRFISADSVIDGVKNPQGYNRYSYVQNNPITYNDPTGHWSVGLGVTIGYTKSGGWSVGVGASWDIGTGPSMNLGATYRVGHLDSARDINDLKYDRSNLSLNTGVTLYYFGFYTGWSLGYDFGSGQATTSTNAGYEIFGFGSGTTLTWGFDTRNDWNPSFTIGQDFFAGGQGGISVGPSVTWTKGEERTRQINFGAFGMHATYSPDAEEGNQWDYGFSTTTTVKIDSDKGGIQKPSNSTLDSVDAANRQIEDMQSAVAEARQRANAPMSDNEFQARYGDEFNRQQAMYAERNIYFIEFGEDYTTMPSKDVRKDPTKSFNADIIVTNGFDQTVYFQESGGNTLPTQTTPRDGSWGVGISAGTYEYSSHTHGGVAGYATLNNDQGVPTRSPNPKQDGESISTQTHIHQGQEQGGVYNRASANCLTVNPHHWESFSQVTKMNSGNARGDVHVIRW